MTPSRKHRELMQALGAGPARPDERARQAAAAPYLGPLELHPVTGPRGQLPLNQPFVWGSVFLARALGKQTRSVSTLGGVYSAGPTLQRCLEVATSEGMERLAVRGAVPDFWESGLRPPALPLRELYSHSRPADQTRRRPWCFATELTTGTPQWVPFESVVVGLPAAMAPQALHHERFYSGAASHRTLTEAVNHATVELLKRDAFLISWYRRRALPRVSWPRDPSALIRRRAGFLQRSGLHVELFDLSLEFALPMLLVRATARRRIGNWPKGGSLLVPCGGFTSVEALEHGLGLTCGQLVSIGLHPAPMKDPLNPARVKATGRKLPFWPLLARYLDPTRGPAHAFLGKGRRPFEALGGSIAASPAARFEHLRRQLAQAGLRWLAVRLTQPYHQSMGFEVVKVVIPGLVGAAPSRREVDFGTRRLWRPWPDATSNRPNRDPHPLY